VRCGPPPAEAGRDDTAQGVQRERLTVLLMQISPTLTVLNGWVAGASSGAALELFIPWSFRMCDTVDHASRNSVYLSLFAGPETQAGEKADRAPACAGADRAEHRLGTIGLTVHRLQ